MMVFLFPSVSRSNSSESRSSSRHNTSIDHSPRSSTSSFSTDIKDTPTYREIQPPLKSPKRFWAFSTQIASPLPPVPDMPGHTRSSSANSLLGTGAEIIRRPSEAARGMKQKAKVERRAQATSPRSPTLETETEAIEARLEAVTTTEPRSAPLPVMPMSYETMPPALPVTAPLRTSNSRTSMKSIRSRLADDTDRRATIKPPPRSALPPIPFSSHLLSVETRPAPTNESNTIVTLEFAYSTDDQCKNDPVKLTFEMLKRGGGHLVNSIEEELSKRDQTGRVKSEQRDSLESERSGPGMTDDGETSEESELDSEYGLEALLRDEYLRSLMLPDSPSFLKDFPPPPPIPETFSINVPTANKPRAQTRNQYAQQDKFPSPSSPFTARSISTLPLNIPPRKAPLSISTAPLPPPSPPKLRDGGGRLTEIKILLLRDSMPYHIIAQRLITGSFVNTALHGETNIAKRKKVEDEARWLGMTRLAEELGDVTERQPMLPGPGLRHKKSGVLTGGQGYI